MPLRPSPEMLEAYRVLLETTDDAILIAEWDSGHFVGVNQVALDRFGYTAAELAGMTALDLSLHSNTEHEQLSQSLIATGEIRAKGVPIRCRDGSVLATDLWVKRFEQDGARYNLNVLRDASSGNAGAAMLEEAHTRLQHSEAFYRGLVEFADDAVFVCRFDGERFVEANPAAQQLFNIDMRDLRRRTITDFLPNVPEEAIRNMRHTLRGALGASVAELLMTRLDGTSFRAHIRLNAYEAAGAKLIVGIVRDVTKQHEREEQLRLASQRLATSEATYRGLVTCTHDAVLIADLESGLFVEANPAACTLFGYDGPAWNQLSLADLTPGDLRSGARTIEEELTQRGSADVTDVRLQRRDGSRFMADVSQSMFEAAGRRLVVAIVRDVTERRRQAQQLAQSYRDLQSAQAKAIHAQKLAAVGEVAAGVAHEVNNPAAFVAMNLDAMQTEVGRVETLVAALQSYIDHEHDSARQAALRGLLEEHTVDVAALASMLHDNRDGIERIRSVTRDLRMFSRVEQSDVVDVDLNDVVRSTLHLLMNELRHRAVLEVELGSVPPVTAQRGKLAQVVTNLVVNASHAIVEGAADSNTITVRTWREGGFVVLSVEDTGVGMDEATSSRIFDPFFTTKPRDQGTGLGLSLCAEIVAHHQGQIAVHSQVGVGTTFEVKIPITTGLRPKPPSLLPTMPTPASAKRVLVIDDDGGMVRAYQRMLSAHDAVVVPGGEQALELIRHGESFDLILCDLMMPDMDGPQVYNAIRTLAPDLAGRVVFCTGGAFTTRVRDFLVSVDNPVLDKPISLDVLERLLAGSFQS